MISSTTEGFRRAFAQLPGEIQDFGFRILELHTIPEPREHHGGGLAQAGGHVDQLGFTVCAVEHPFCPGFAGLLLATRQPTLVVERGVVARGRFEEVIKGHGINPWRGPDFPPGFRGWRQQQRAELRKLKREDPAFTPGILPPGVGQIRGDPKFILAEIAGAHSIRVPSGAIQAS